MRRIPVFGTFLRYSCSSGCSLGTRSDGALLGQRQQSPRTLDGTCSWMARRIELHIIFQLTLKQIQHVRMWEAAFLESVPYPDEMG